LSALFHRITRTPKTKIRTTEKYAHVTDQAKRNAIEKSSVAMAGIFAPDLDKKADKGKIERKKLIEKQGVNCKAPMTGSHEVRGSIPLSSTKKIKGLGQIDLSPF